MASIPNENFDPDKISNFRKMVDGCVEYAQKHNVPIQVVEGAMRDVLAGVDAHRLLTAIRRNGGKL